MITAERKPFDEIYAMTEGHDKVLVAGCARASRSAYRGEKEAEILAASCASRPRRRSRRADRAHRRHPPV